MQIIRRGDHYENPKLVGDFYKPDAALVPFSNAGFVMDAEQAVYAITELIKSRYVIPFHDFPAPSEAADPEGMERFLKAFPSSVDSMGIAQPFLAMMKGYKGHDVRYLAVGQSTDLP